MHRSATLQSLHNRYFGLRHGESEANRLGIIISDPANGVDGYGLTDLGRRQVRQSLLDSHGLSSHTLTFCSDFRRARETAEIATDLLGSQTPVADTRLRERFFGAVEKGSNEAYAGIWQKDAVDPRHQDGGCESSQSVHERMIALIESLESRYEDRTILLVSHGDPLEILATAVAGKLQTQRREIPYWETAELREF